MYVNKEHSNILAFIQTYRFTGLQRNSVNAPNTWSLSL
jgi:hypothetical protein